MGEGHRSGEGIGKAERAKLVASETIARHL
jgi:hypothetical protein